jgi:aspartate racemase
MAKHIGIVGCSIPGSALCYRELCEYASTVMGQYDHPQVTVSTIPMARYMPHFEPLDPPAIARLLLESTRIVAAAGAQFAICPDNSCHLAYDEVVRESPIPWLHIAKIAVGEAQRRGFKHLGVLGTRFTMQMGLYERAVEGSGLTALVPTPADQKIIDDVIWDELVHDVISDASRQRYVDVIERLKHQGCDAVVLGCTEIPLLISDKESPLPTLDSTRLLARAAVHEALAS